MATDSVQVKHTGSAVEVSEQTKCRQDSYPPAQLVDSGAASKDEYIERLQEEFSA